MLFCALVVGGAAVLLDLDVLLRVVGGVGAVALLVAGIGLFAAREWARILGGFACFALGVTSLVLGHLFIALLMVGTGIQLLYPAPRSGRESSLATVSAIAMLLFAVVVGGVAVLLDLDVLLRVIAGVGAIALIVSGIGLFTAQEWARLLGGSACIGLGLLVSFLGPLLLGLLIVATGVQLLHPATRNGLEAIRSLRASRCGVA